MTVIPLLPDAPEQIDNWPQLDQAALHGPIGDYVTAAASHTEADPVAILAQLLAGVGCLANSGTYALAGNDQHPAALYVGVVGQTAKAKKGTSWAAARIVLSSIDPDFTTNRIFGGFGSGESLIETLGPPKTDEPTAGPRDTRALLYEGEFAALLKVAGRDSSTLGQQIRNAWDGRPLSARTRGRGTVTAAEYHFAVIGHITIEELTSTLTNRDTYGGTVNRFLWTAARSTKRLPDGGNIPKGIIDTAADQLSHNLALARNHGCLRRTPAADQRWADLYNLMGDDDPPGLLGAAIARAEAQCLRISIAYAIADGADSIDLDHLEAAWALWNYCRATAALIFPPKTDDRDKLLDAIRLAGDHGLTKASIFGVFNNNANAKTIDGFLDELIDLGLIRLEKVSPSGIGRKAMIAYAMPEP
jgi:hypothetical protein